MPGQYNAQVTRTQTTAGREIKASAHYTYIQNGITLDGTKFAAGALVLEGQCLMRSKTTGKYEPYADATGALPTTHDDFVILDTSVRFDVIDGANTDVIVGQVLVHGAVYKGMLIGVTDAFIAETKGSIRYVSEPTV